MNTKVFITQETNYDFSPAEQFGEVVFLTHKDLNNMRASQHNDRVVAEIKDKLKHYDSERDWIVVAGSPYISALVFMLLGHKKINSIKVLRWDNRDFRYVPLHIELRREIVASWI
jgi:hypothetical protein